MEFLLKLFMQMLIDASANSKTPKVIRLLILTIILFMPITIGVLAGLSALESADIKGVITYWMIAAGCMLLWALGYDKIHQTKRKRKKNK